MGEIMIKSPLNYTGGKYKLLPQILPLFPRDIHTFVDLFCGGCNVGLNIECSHVVYNDTGLYLRELYSTLKELDYKDTIKHILSIISEYNLSQSSEHDYNFYGCDSVNGLMQFNRDGFTRLKHDFNTRIEHDAYYYLMLYVLIIYAFNNQIRFNASGAFNLPVGKRDFNAKMKKKLENFITRIKQQNCEFTSIDFRKYNVTDLTEHDFVYADPPYLVSCATYNENGGWDEDMESALLAMLERLNTQKVRFALSNVLTSKGKVNTILEKWLQHSGRNCVVHHLKFSYSNSNYHAKNRELICDEVLITNY